VNDEFAIRFDWGRTGAERSAAAGRITVIVDTLTFSTTVAIAADRGMAVLPAISDDEANALARTTSFPRTVPRIGAPPGAFTLSPATVRDAAAAPRALVVHSPNGARCTRAAHDAPAVFVGALINASAVARAVHARMRETGLGVTVVACGERPMHAALETPLRFAIEDHLGAGAIVEQLAGARSPEAAVAVHAFRACAHDLTAILERSATGRELSSIGCPEDWRIASQLDTVDRAATIADGWAGRAIYPIDAIR
jgi:2-phosphosulfolactate phosphatase